MRQQLLDTIKSLEEQLKVALVEFVEFDSKAENNVFETLDDATSEFTDGAVRFKLEKQAYENCGDGFYGESPIKQEFIVDGKKYVGVLDVIYGRANRQYYYVDETEFHVEEL